MRKKSFKPPIRKKYSLLIELLVALALVVMCLFPLLTPHFRMQKELFKRSEQMQLHRLAETAALEVKVQLYENIYPWKKLNSATPVKGTLEEVFLSQKSYKPYFELSKLRHYTRKSDGAHFLFMRLDIYFQRNHINCGHFASHLFLQEVSTKKQVI